MMPKVFLVVPSYGHYDYVYETVRSAFECTPDISVCIFDDATPPELAPSPESWDNWNQFDHTRTGFVTFDKNGGLTRSWNAGLQLARQGKFDYAICGNSDLIFSPGWWEPIQKALDDGWALAGPVSNAAGTTIGCRQGILNYLPDYKVSDQTKDIEETSARLKAKGDPINSPLNGFCLCAKTATWWDNAFDADHVFDPQYKMTLNEDRLQKRWRAKGLKFCVVPTSFVLHYRSVTRGTRYVQGQWLRKGEIS
jgi:glycosyltransferase involved in cell wall biosynthesis